MTLPRLARSRTGYHGSLTLYRDEADRPQVSVYPMESTAGHEPSPRTAAALTAVLRACAEHVEQRPDFPQILTASRERGTPALLRFLTWSADYHRSAAAHLEDKALASRPALRAAVTAWWTVARWFTAQPHPVLLLMLANLDGSLARAVDVQEWWGPTASPRPSANTTAPATPRPKPPPCAPSSGPGALSGARRPARPPPQG